MIAEGSAQCPCCDYYTLHDRGSHEVCPVCYWEDDGADLDALDKTSPLNHLSLRSARQNFERIGASDQAAVALVANAEERDGLRREQRATYF